MTAAVIKCVAPSGVVSYAHVDPEDVRMVQRAAWANEFQADHVGYTVCPSEDHDGRCVCFDGEE